MAVHKNRNSGFTLLETLLTVAVLVILLGLSIVGIARYRDHLKITELDNAARDIYMAAENRAVLLQNSGAAVSLLSSPASPALGGEEPKDITVTVDGENKSLRVLSKNTNILETLLPTGVIDPALRDGYFYILYDRDTYHVYEVFYAEEKFATNLESDLAPYRETRAKRVSYYREKKSERCLVGHYLGGLADDIGTKILPNPIVDVLITNSEELTLKVTYTIPTAGLPSLNPDGTDPVTRIPSVKLKYNSTGPEVTLLDKDGDKCQSRRIDSGDITSPGITTITYTWVLDSLESGKQFKELFSNPNSIKLGDDFTVNASLKLTAEGYLDNFFNATGTDNSLFAKGTNYSNSVDDKKTYTDVSGNTTKVPANTALIANLRHLQNLDKENSFKSNVGDGIKNAVQLCDIDCEKAKRNDGPDITPTGESYNFIPIVNTNLTSYNGQNNHIYSLSAITTADAGLFGEVSKPLNIENTRVCWKADDDNDYDELNNKLVSGDHINYKVSGTNAGGLIGSVSNGGDVTIKNSFAATTVEGANNAGGLIGSVGTGGKVTIEKSYADCYLKATGNNTNVGGLVGSGTVNKLENCYAAGFIVEPPENAKTAGLVNGSVNASNTYSVVRVIKTDSEDKTKLGQPEYPLYVKAGGTEPAEDDKTNHVYYLYRAGEIKASDFVGGAFEDVEKENTHPYDLRYKLSSPTDESLELKDKTYPFPGIKNLPHYCDWAELDATELVYYEIYETNTLSERYGMATVYKKDDSNGNKKGDTLSILLKDDIENPVVTKDGYALAFKKGTKLDVKKGYTVEYGTGNSKQTWTLTKVSAADTDINVAVEDVSSWEWKKGEGGNTQTDVKSFEIDDTGANNTTDTKYVLIPLPDEVVTGSLAKEDKFYQQIVCGEDEKTFFFNPHFAKSVKLPEKDDNGNDKKDANGNVIPPDEPTVGNVTKQNDSASPAYVRTPRHLYDLSRAYGSGTSKYYYYNKDYYFEQELDLDYSTYEGYTSTGANIDRFAPKSDNTFRKQDPIGSQSNPFRGTYDGGCHIIKNVFFKPNGTNLGLFGVTESGYTSNIPNSKLVNVVYEMNPATTGFETVTKAGANVGALLGQNNCEVTNCAVYGVNMEVTATNIGGLVGQNNGTITNCAAEVAPSKKNASPTDEVTWTCTNGGGLVGQNNSTISNSYAIGKIKAEATTTTIAGLVADNKGSINDSYAAVDLDGIDERYGLCKGGDAAVSKSGWLKDVFVYRGVKYNITATTDYRDPSYAATFTELKNDKLKTQSEAKKTVRNVPSGASYENSYKDKSFPYLTGVKGLDRNADGKILSSASGMPIHYGLWPAPLPVGLAYYEKYYGSNDYGANGQFENQEIATLKDDKQNPVVTKDGYALVFEGTNADIPLGEYSVKYGNTNVQDWTLTKTNAEYTWKYNTTTQSFSYSDIITITQPTTYTLIPLPDQIVTGELPGGDVKTAKYFQKLVYGDGLFSQRDFYFNPHFAGRLKQQNGKTVLVSVEAGTVDAKNNYTAPVVQLDEPENGRLDRKSYSMLTLPNSEVKSQWEKHAISVRTPRHLYELSCYQETYTVENKKVSGGEDDLIFKRYYFKQELNLDYSTYEGYPGIFEPKNGSLPFMQDPIGKGGWRHLNDSNHWEDDGFKGVYDGGNHSIKNVFYNTSTNSGNFDTCSQYIGLFRYAEYLWNVTYEVPDNMVCNLSGFGKKEPSSMGMVFNEKGARYSGWRELRVGTLAGGSYRPENCTVILRNLTFNFSDDNANILVGGLIGYGSFAEDCHVIQENGVLSVKGTGNSINVSAGGVMGILWNKSSYCTSKLNSLSVETTGGDAYGGGVVGFSSDNSSAFRKLLYSSAKVGNVNVTASKKAYGGGLAGWCDRMKQCSAVVTGEVTVTGASAAYGGGLAGGGADIRSCAAIAKTVEATGTISYVGGLVGTLKDTGKPGSPWANDPLVKIREDPPDDYIFRMQNSYAAVAELQGTTRGAVYGMADTSARNISASIEYCYYLNDGISWNFNGTNYMGNYTTTDGGTEKTYDDLEAPSFSITGMGRVNGTNAYPFPISTRLPNGQGTRGNENGFMIMDGAYFYPGTVWPMLGNGTNTVSEVSEPEDETLAPEAEPIAPDTEPEPGEEESAEEAESEIEPAA